MKTESKQSKEALKAIKNFKSKKGDNPLLMDRIKFYTELDNSLKHNEDIMHYVLKDSLAIWSYLPEDIKHSKEWVLKLINSNNNFLSHLDDNFKKDKDIVLKACLLNGLNLKYADDGLNDHFDIALVAVSNNGFALKHCSERLKSDEKIVVSALNQQFSSISYSNLELWQNPEVLLKNISYPEFIDFISMDARIIQNMPYFKLIKNQIKVHQNKSFALHVEPQMVKSWSELLSRIDKHKDSNNYLTNEIIDFSEPLIKFWSNKTMVLLKQGVEKMETKYPEFKDMLLMFIEKETQRRSIVDVKHHKHKSKPIKTRKISF
jgi:hypothetical protein